jgi:uncharacterized membrane protein
MLYDYNSYLMQYNNNRLAIANNLLLPVLLHANLITMKTLGIVFVILGAVMLIWTGFTYTKKEKLIDAGPIQVSADREKTVNWPPYAGGVLLLGGIALIALAKKS